MTRLAALARHPLSIVGALMAAASGVVFIVLVIATYGSRDEADRAIDRAFRDLYESRDGTVDKQAVMQAVGALQAVYRRSVFPEMKLTWGSYPDNKGHVTATGCFRCHDGSHVDKTGAAINADCEYCHTQVEAP